MSRPEPAASTKDPMLGVVPDVPKLRGDIPYDSIFDTAEPSGLDDYAHLVANLRAFLNTLAAAHPDPATITALDADLQRWRERLAGHLVGEDRQVFGRRHDLVGRGQSASPPLDVEHRDAESIRGRVTFGRYFLGGNGAVHGGAVPMVFDELFGRLSNSSGRPFSRTAYLHLDYRSITPVGVELTITGRIVTEHGRKRVIRGELRDGERICVQAEGLFIALLPGQQ